MGPVKTNLPWAGSRPASLAAKKSTFSLMVIFGSLSSMFSKMRV